MKNKIGVGVITYNRSDLFRQCINSIPDTDQIVVVNDGKPYDESFYPGKVDNVIQHSRNRGIAKSKNDALKYLMSKDCEHIFLCEDDIKLRNAEVINLYIKASINSNIKHLNYGYHGPWNKDENGKPVIRKSKKFNGSNIVFHSKLTGAFSYYSREVIEKVGYMNEVYKNVIEHVDHTYRISLAGFHPPFYWFPDIGESFEYIDELDENLESSTIRQNVKIFDLKVRVFNRYFKLKNKYSPGEIPDAPAAKLEEYLNKISIK